MKQTVLSLAALAALAGAGSVQAQSNVTLYGLLDAGMQNTSNATAGKGSLTSVHSGGMNTSRWGVRGSEDLGQGLKAVFQLEGGFLLDTGAQDGALFKRQSNVGLEGAFGKVVLGRSFSTVYDFMLPFDPMGYSANYSWATSANASGPSKYGMTTAFDNLVKYAGKVGDFRFGASYGMGEQPGGAGDSAKMAAAASYKSGPLSFVATYEQVNGNTLPATGRRDKTSAVHLGAMYANGPLKIQAAARDYRKVDGAAAAPDVRGTLYWTGASYQSTPAITLTGAVYYQDVKNAAANADPVMYVGRLRYALSKRTDLYLAAAFAKAKNQQLVSLSRDDAGFADTQRGVTAGIQHRF